MKKLFSVILAALLSITMMAADANIYASEVSISVSGTTASISYVLNAPATTLELAILNSDKEIVKSYPITDAAALTKGEHSMEVTVEADVTAGQYWVVKAAAAMNETFQKVSDDTNQDLWFYLPQGLVINNIPTHKNFGKAYVAMPWPGESDGGSARTIAQTGGMYVLDALLEAENEKGYQYGLKFIAGNRKQFARPTMDAEGMLYVTDYQNSKIYKIDPADTTACDTFANNSRVTVPVAIAMDIDGGLFVMDNPNTANGGTLKKLYAAKDSVIIQSSIWANTDMSLAIDGKGGVWVAQNRAAIDVYSLLAHVNAQGEIDYQVNSNSPKAVQDLFPNLSQRVSVRGAMAVNNDGTMLAVGSEKTAIVFAISYDANGVPSLDKKYQTTELGGNIDGIAFDVVDNLYVMSASIERLQVWALPRVYNEYPITKKPVVLAESVTVTPAASDEIEVGDSFQFSASVLPVTTTDQTITWSVEDENIATVNNGLVTAVTPGTTKVFAATTNGVKGEATVTVIAKKWYYPNVYAYDITLTPANEQGQYKLDYKLNAPATAVKLVLKGANDPIEIDLNGKAFGANTETIDLKDMVAGDYQWGIYAAADLVSDEDVMQVNTFTMNAFSASRGMTVNINPASPRFGQIIVVDAVGKTAEGTGFKVYDPMFQGNDVLYTGAWSAGAASPMRVTIGQDDDLIYISDWSDEQPNIHIYDPADLTKETLVFGGTTEGGGLYKNEAGDTIHGSMSSCYVIGKGENRVLYTFDEDMLASEGHAMGMFRYDIGTLAEPWTAKPSAVVYDNADGYEANGNSIILPDKFGGWFISQDRATDNASIPALIHINAQGAVDYNSSGLLGGRTRGTFALNYDHTLAVTAGDNCLNIWKVTWDENNAPSLEKDYTIPTTFGAQTSSTCYNVCFDYANNVYAIGDGKPLCVWAGWVDENESTVMMGELTIEPTSLYEMINELDKVEKVVENGILYIIRDGEKFNTQGAKL
ncbi:MAG: Ig-like domain-containing protein [Paludibacteraceae bacterium]|nr:Ig-like domain-containing protein [Paludibacteraceae bacterium]